MAQQTAIEWLEHQILISNGLENLIGNIDYWIEQAKQMEKEQIVDAHYQGYRNDIGTTEVSEQYYNETYNKKN